MEELEGEAGFGVWEGKVDMMASPFVVHSKYSASNEASLQFLLAHSVPIPWNAQRDEEQTD